MPRKSLIRQSKFPYHVITRTNNREWFPLPMFQVWDLCKEALIYAQSKCMVEINCFVLMSNHYHMILTTPNEDIDIFMRFFNSRFSSLLAKNSNRINQKFSNRYRWSIIDNQSYLKNVYRYLYQNPIRAGIAESCGDYPYSSLFITSYEARLINFRPHFHYADEQTYFERRFGADTISILKRALKHPRFKLAERTPSYEKMLLGYADTLCKNR
ncbi:transposase IS200-like protein [Bacteriovorax sp. BAL6_X]|uniref:transposase n=1 Tax=Bacteriovorax sp. BAL6_X TaxID=1201290 RepID=UPI0003861BEE|nr:transposase [Bacteriovorax sp. BAL6_X]EPZ49742.1 transposase IS200-like protein [Bacteriovorax sp. BAL6_X]